MHITQPVWVIGMMSGTSLDGVDAALIRTDGVEVAETGAHIATRYPREFRRALRQLLNGEGDEAAIARQLTEHHADAIDALLDKAAMPRSAVALIGMHGQTLWHKPKSRQTKQIGDANWLAARTGIPVVHDFRANDMANGGQGAPFVPLYHAALATDLPKPLAVVNIGGVSNITYIASAEAIIAFDCGMGNALMDDWVSDHTDGTFAYDKDGKRASHGEVDLARVSSAMQHPFFAEMPPKSLDRLDFSADMAQGLSYEDGLATLAAFTVQGIIHGIRQLPHPPARVLVCGGGRLNLTLMKALSEGLHHIPVDPVRAVGWDGDMLEAQAFGFLAARSVRGLPLSLPGTTGVSSPMTGGVLIDAA
jgi:anhydro-N-acetylmuramic acid kinase